MHLFYIQVNSYGFPVYLFGKLDIIKISNHSLHLKFCIWCVFFHTFFILQFQITKQETLKLIRNNPFIHSSCLDVFNSYVTILWWMEMLSKGALIFLCNMFSLDICQKFTLQIVGKGQKKSKLFFQVDVSSKKMNEQILLYYYETSGRFFGGNWRHQKDILKLSDL